MERGRLLRPAARAGNRRRRVHRRRDSRDRARVRDGSRAAVRHRDVQRRHDDVPARVRVGAADRRDSTRRRNAHRPVRASAARFGATRARAGRRQRADRRRRRRRFRARAVPPGRRRHCGVSQGGRLRRTGHDDGRPGDDGTVGVRERQNRRTDDGGGRGTSVAGRRATAGARRGALTFRSALRRARRDGGDLVVLRRGAAFGRYAIRPRSRRSPDNRACRTARRELGRPPA
ncbi:MAG: hypothetical protein QOF71_3138 [Candidatus Eremiobacteraeota bacterium]|nr:hypothetical protein [Candidatus Eremiobacteraeota bacterium]